MPPSNLLTLSSGYHLDPLFLLGWKLNGPALKLEEWRRNEQFWLIGGPSAHLTAVVQSKVVAGIEISFTLTSKSAADDENEEFADLYINQVDISYDITNHNHDVQLDRNIAVAVSRTTPSDNSRWSSLLGGVLISSWVLAHLHPFAKGTRGRTSAIVLVGLGLIANHALPSVDCHRLSLSELSN